MHNFKKHIRVLLVAVITVLVLLGLDFALYPCTFMRNDIHAVSTQSVDDLYVGTSHGKINIDPETMESVTGRTGHNVCVGGEYAIDSYHIVKLAIEKGNKPKRVVYEISAGYFVQEKEEGNNYLLFYHEFPLSLTKLEYFKNSLLRCNFRTMLFPWYEYKLSYELKKLAQTIPTKWNRDYSVDNLKSKTQEYHESGFIERYPVDEENFSAMNLTVFEEEKMSASNMEYLEKLIHLCKKEGIEFVAVTTPMPKVSLVEYAENFEAMDAYFQAFFDEQEVNYVNFNNRTYYPMFTHKTEYYTDYDGHMNGDAAREFSAVLAEVLTEVCGE